VTRLSILITKSEALGPFEDTLASVLANRPDESEIVVICPGGYDDPYDLAKEVRFLRAPRDASYSELVNQALPQLRGEIVHLIGCGLSVAEGWSEAALACFVHSDVVAVASYIVTHSRERILTAGIVRDWIGRRRWVGQGKRLTNRQLRRRYTAGPARQAAFFHRTKLQQYGGFDETMGDGLADLDLAITIRKDAGGTIICPGSQIYGDRLPDAEEGSFREGLLSERLFWKHNESWATLPLHAVACLAEFLVNLPRGRSVGVFLGRAVGLLQAPFSAQYYKRQRQSRESLAERPTEAGAARNPKTHRRSAA
jgi:hypothetical protein